MKPAMLLKKTDRNQSGPGHYSCVSGRSSLSGADLHNENLGGKRLRAKSHVQAWQEKVSYSGFVIPETGELVVTKPSWFNYETVIQSMRDFINAKPCPDGKRYCIILDNAPWHKKAIRLIWTEKHDEYADIREKLDYLSLPPYSPDLNPIEQVWRKTRREKTHNRYFGVLSKLAEVLDTYLGQFFMPNEQLRSLCSFGCFI